MLGYLSWVGRTADRGAPRLDESAAEGSTISGAHRDAYGLEPIRHDSSPPTAKTVAAKKTLVAAVRPRFVIQDQIELERRVNLPALPLRVSSTYSSRRGTDRTGVRLTPAAADGKIELKSIDDLVIDLLDRFHTGRMGSSGNLVAGVCLAPFESRHTHWHIGPEEREAALAEDVAARKWWSPGEYVSPKRFTSADPERYTRELEAPHVQFTNMGQSKVHTYDISAYRYIVGNEFESAIYYDTPDHRLAQQGLAVREKSWARGFRGGEPGEVTSRAVFVKEQLGEERGFTSRREVSITLSADRSDEHLLLAQQALLDKLGAELGADALRPMVRIDNNRFVVDLIVRTEDWKVAPQKIGFLTIDLYTSHPLDEDGAPLRLPVEAPRQVQLEYELLPEHQDLPPKVRGELDQLIQEIETTYSATVVAAPKYRQGLDAIAALLGPSGNPGSAPV